MLTNIVMIRHFMTKGNETKRYIGSTDEPLSDAGKIKCNAMNYPVVEAVFASPMIRCIETAGLIYPDYRPVLVPEFRECNFGDFENKNYLELADNLEYQAWIDSGGTIPFPNGESIHSFQERCLCGFEEMLQICARKAYKTIAMVVHGGTIMSILDRYSNPHQDYFDWRVDNGEGYLVAMEEDKWRITKL